MFNQNFILIGDCASIASYCNQLYLITESYYYGTETEIFAYFNNLEESEETSERSFYEWLLIYGTHALATFKLKQMEEKDKKG